MSVDAIAWKCVSRIPGGRWGGTMGMPGVTNTSHFSVSCRESLRVIIEPAFQSSPIIGAPLDLLHRAHPVLHMVCGRKLVAPDSEDVDRDRLETPAGRAHAEELPRRSSGRFAAYDDAIPQHHEILDLPGQVRDTHADFPEHIG